MDKRSQVELKTMIESVLFMNELETQLPKEFDEVLKRRTGSVFVSQNESIFTPQIFTL